MTAAPETPLAATGHGAPSVTTWTRLEPQTAAADLRDSAAARIEDPAWLLCRQWQLGEFRGSDGGSPVDARLRLRSGGFAAYRGLGGYPDAPGEPEDYDPAALPLETLVEREAEGEGELGLRADGGRQFLRALAAAGLGAYGPAFAAAFPLPEVAAGPAVDPATADRLRLLVGRVPDARALARAFVPAPGAEVRLPDAPAVAEEHRAGVLAAASDFAARWAALVSRPGAEGSAWVPHRAEHRFALGAYLDSPLPVHVGEYPGGHLDWPDFSIAGDEYNVPYGEQAPLVTRSALPTPLTYPGMPTERWWEFEDASVSLVGTEAGGSDLGRLLMLEFATLYSNDWFVIPVELPVGSMTRVQSLVVTDTFGQRVLVEPAGGQGWEMFRCGLATTVLPPVLPDSLEGAPVEDVLLLRDENANLAWAVEQVVESPLGTPVDRHERHLAALREADEPVAESADLVYRVRTDLPPEHWVPLLPEAGPDGPRLRRSALRPPGGAPVPPAGRLLADTPSLAAEEVPRDGARLTRAWQRARWSDGSTHLWLSRRKLTGRGEVSSGLQHDTLSRGGGA